MATRARHAFTLTEMLVVLLVVVVLLALLLPGFAAVREKARRALCAGNLRSHGQAAASYGLDYQNLLPLMTMSDGVAPPSPRYLPTLEVLGRYMAIPEPVVEAGGIRRIPLLACPLDRDDPRGAAMGYAYRPGLFMFMFDDPPPEVAQRSVSLDYDGSPQDRVVFEETGFMHDRPKNIVTLPAGGRQGIFWDMHISDLPGMPPWLDFWGGGPIIASDPNL